MKVVKPTLKYHTGKAYLWRDAVRWVEQKRLGGRDIRDFAGRFKGGFVHHYDVPYQDYWNMIVNWKSEQISNPCYIDLAYDVGEEYCNMEPWQEEITLAFQAEFSKEALYYVDW